MSRTRRTETLNADFVDGYAHGWCFGVHEAFRAPLDISLDTRADRAANQALAERLGRRPSAAERITRTVWTQGNPPAYAFSRGQLMHEPATVATLPWAEALALVQRSVMVVDAQPDAGALLQATQPGQDDDDPDEAMPRPGAGRSAEASEDADPARKAGDPATGEPHIRGMDHDAASTEEPAGTGWVDIEIHRYDQGRITHRERCRLGQAAFVQLLRDGTLPADCQPVSVTDRIG